MSGRDCAREDAAMARWGSPSPSRAQPGPSVAPAPPPNLVPLPTPDLAPFLAPPQRVQTPSERRRARRLRETYTERRTKGKKKKKRKKIKDKEEKRNRLSSSARARPNSPRPPAASPPIPSTARRDSMRDHAEAVEFSCPFREPVVRCHAVAAAPSARQSP